MEAWEWTGLRTASPDRALAQRRQLQSEADGRAWNCVAAYHSPTRSRRTSQTRWRVRTRPQCFESSYSQRLWPYSCADAARLSGTASRTDPPDSTHSPQTYAQM